ncbi:MAG: SpoIIE family protein phosphatase [Bacillota bacterium]|nr:SpoIIE family protein phosphatase [Bacillota bacterium]
MKRTTLQNKLLKTITLFVLILILGTNLIIGLHYWRERMDDYSSVAFSYARAMAKYIDGDKISEYLQSGETDDYYDNVLKLLTSFAEETDIKYFYVMIPRENDIFYIWDAIVDDEPWPLGYTEPYSAGEKKIRDLFLRGETEDSLVLEYENYGFLASAHVLISNSQSVPVALACVDLSITDLIQETLDFMMKNSSFAILIGFVVAVMLLFYVKRNVVKPLDTLNLAAKNMVERLDGQGSTWIDVRTDNEIQDLAYSFMQMNQELKNYIHKLHSVTAEQQRISAELDVATHIQSSMLPCTFPPFPNRKEIDIYATMTPAKEVGGDFYDFFLVDERHLAIVMADVSGKGVPAALFMVIGKTLIKDHTTPGCDLGEVFTEVNSLLCGANSEDMFITAFEGILDLVSGELRFVNAGHEPPFLARGGKPFARQPVKAAMVLAGMEGIRYTAGSLQMEPGDKLFQYTDGVTEATSAELELYGMARLEEVLAGATDKSPQDILTTVKKDIDRFVGDAPQFDDITMLCLESKANMRQQIEAFYLEESGE